MPVGFNLKKPDDNDKGNIHYRRYYNKELEHVIDPNGEQLVVSPFLTENITKLQQKKKKSLFKEVKRLKVAFRNMKTCNLYSFFGVMK